MTKVKPKTALAQLLDNVKNAGEMALAENTVLTEEHIIPAAKKPKDFYDLSADISPKDNNTPYLIELLPEQCFPWQFADRPEEEMGDIEALGKSIASTGQQEPILVRPLQKGSGAKYEIIFGHRRWRACKLIDKKVLAIVKSLTDQEAALFQKEENENRENISDYARAKSYQSQLNAGIFQSETELSKCLFISKQTLSDIMAYNRIPSELINAIPNFRQISRKTVVKIASLARNTTLLPQLIKLGKRIGEGSITSANLDSHLLDNTTDNKTITPDYKNTQDNSGQELFKCKIQPNGEMVIKIHKALQGKYEEEVLIAQFKKLLLDMIN